MQDKITVRKIISPDCKSVRNQRQGKTAYFFPGNLLKIEVKANFVKDILNIHKNNQTQLENNNGGNGVKEVKMK